MAEKKDNNIIDLGQIAKKIYAKRKLFLTRIWPITFVLSCLIIICVPRYYTSDAKLAPEWGNSMAGGTLGSLASTFGLSLGGITESSDAINPMLYPDLMEDNGFVTGLFNIQVKSADGEIDTNYYDYLRNHQKSAWWSGLMKWIKDTVSSLFPKKEDQQASTGSGEKTPYWLSEAEHGAAEAVRSNINFSVDKLTAVISISATAQDPLIAKTLADSVQAHLQHFITEYRTNKALVDEKHYEELYQEAKLDYEKVCTEYARVSDANSNVVLSRYKVQIENMERDMQLKYMTLQNVAAQLQIAKAKVQERTPAFTVIKGASVAQRPAGPKRMMFVLGMLTMVTFAFMFWFIRKELHF